MSWLELAEVGDLLEEPGEASQQLRGHDPVYGEIKDGFDAVRDTCNSGIDKVNGWIAEAGLGNDVLPKLPESSLDEYVVFPLSGNYYRIQQNGAACGILRDGMSAWGDNFGKVAANSVLAFEGQANVAFVAHLGAYGLVMKGVGAVMSKGSGVFDSIAKVSERIAIRVERTLIEMGKKLLKLAKVVSKRFLGGWVSAAMLVKDLAQHGLAVITDVIDDIKWCLEAIEKCFTLKDEVQTWAETQADRLEAFKDLVSIVDELPHIDLSVPLADVEVPDLKALEALIADLDLGIDPSETEEGSEAEDELDDAGDELAEDSGYVHPSWAEACVTPPPGMGQDPYDPNMPIAPNGTVLSSMPEEMEMPIPGVSNTAYYKMYERWRHTIMPPRFVPPPAEGQPADA